MVQSNYGTLERTIFIDLLFTCLMHMLLMLKSQQFLASVTVADSFQEQWMTQ